MPHCISPVLNSRTLRIPEPYQGYSVPLLHLVETCHHQLVKVSHVQLRIYLRLLMQLCVLTSLLDLSALRYFYTHSPGQDITSPSSTVQLG